MIPLYDRNPTRTVPFFTIALIAINTLVFLYELALSQRASEALVYAYGVVPVVWTHPTGVERHALTFVTCMFLHGGLLHLLGNMLYLWIFGNNVEDALGHVPFVLFYLVSGVAASITHVAFNATSAMPIIGASGAISGVLGAYILYYPRARVVGLLIIIPFLWMPTFETTAFFFLAVFFILQIVSAQMPAHVGGGVAWWAHIGGFVAGFALALLLPRRR